MHCPQCTGYTLEPKLLDENLVAASCPKCEGALLPLLNYRHWVNQRDADVEKVDVEVISEDVEHAKMCPKCSRLMTKFRIDLRTQNKLDLCTHCDEAWLDKGEWKLPKQLELAGQLPKIFTEEWQRELRRQQQINRVNQRYQNTLGEEDFEKVRLFKEWMEQHDNTAEIRQYLLLSV
ncbi:zf-TFIIB domain-containing protein [Hahella ganghwensis]|uniref:zf-TFIIB domain-containing protein n=1 Tax=Hahella ganghwensis TaxID=286420 RepID=UPI0003651056|nr:zf-TFIIB domain-containing protein [Hahella ganghwensis]